MPSDQDIPAFLGVTASLTGRSWVGPGIEDDRLAEAMIQRTGLPEAVARVLCRAGVESDAADAYLAPSLRDLLPDPRSLLDMDAAAERFLHALQHKERIAVFGDYDVDGAASTALLAVWLREMGLCATLYIPDRIDEGYGPNTLAMAELAKTHDLIVCVDCGTLSHDAIAAARGADVIVLDHHLGGETLPECRAVVNPNRQDEPGTLSHLCAAAVVFLLLVEVNRRMRDAGRTGPDLMAMLDLVALATVADVAPLIGVNRAFVRQGLKVMGQRQRPGLVALADVARMDGAPTAYHLGFLLGPRINAGGRIGAADLGARLLSSNDPHEAAALAERLDQLNTDRREVEAEVRAAALAQAESRSVDGPLVWAAGEGWHPGVVGIVAARLKEATGRPAVVIGIENGAGKGSGRSIGGVDLGAAVQQLAMEGAIEKGGGHRMAAGLSLSADQIAPAMARLGELLGRQGAGQGEPRRLKVSAQLMASGATAELIERIEAAGPFGMGAPAPTFAFANCRIAHVRRVGESHLKIRIAGDTGPSLDAIAFGAFDGPIGPAIEAHGGRRFHILGRLELNRWGGRTQPQLRLSDAAEA